jgi:hypothetical protein
MRRREFITLVGSAAAVSRGQQRGGSGSVASGPESMLDNAALKELLAKYGGPQVRRRQNSY